MSDCMEDKFGLKKSQYVQKFIDTVMGIRGVRVYEHLEEMIFQNVSRLSEVKVSIRDQWGNWEWSFSDAQREGKLYHPWIDEPLSELRHRLMREHPEWPWMPLWPDGRSFALCLTHDVDLVSQYHTITELLRMLYRTARSSGNKIEKVRRLIRSLQSLTIYPSQIRTDPLWHYEDWLKLEDSYGFRSTFFFFPSYVAKPSVWDAQYHFDDRIRFSGRLMKVRDMMQIIRRAGWDIGLHGSYYSATEPGILGNELSQIEGVIGEKVISIRQHWLHYDTLRTPRLQAEAGLLCDSTQGFNRNIGFRAGTSFPYWCWDHESQSPLPVLEIPMHIMDGALFTTNALEYNLELAIHHCVQLLDRVAKVGGCLTLNWHPNYLNDDKWWSVYKTLLEEAARRNAWGCSVGQLYSWWTQRERCLEWIPASTLSGI